ncbi:MAG: trehalase family glycosidase [archaeon]
MKHFIFKTAIYGVLLAVSLFGQVKVRESYLLLNATADDPLFTTYASAMERSRFFADKAYFMDYFTPDKPICYSSQFAGDFAVIWKVNNIIISQTQDFFRKPVVIASFPDMAILDYEPFDGLQVREVFMVYSSGAAIIDMTAENKSREKYDFNLYPLIFKSDQGSLLISRFDSTAKGYFFSHYEPTERLHSNLDTSRGYPTEFNNVLTCNQPFESYGGYTATNIQDFYFAAKRLSKVHANVTRLNEPDSGLVDIIALQKHFRLKPGEKTSVRFVRGLQDLRNPETEMVTEVQMALKADLQRYVDENIALFESVPKIRFKNPKEKMVYIGALNLVRQCMMPPEGKTQYNFYNFSRNPIWGWGHGHQVMHESLSMLPYAYLDSQSAQESQRIYIEQQYDDGLIGYRHGPRGPQVYSHEGKATTSAPFFTWTNWEIYSVSRDTTFLRDGYQAGSAFVHYLERERDVDGDGLFEWGPYGIIENVRDGWNVVFQLFSEGEDEGRDISDELEALDLSCQVANEMYYLRLMAKELGDTKGEAEWTLKFNRLAKLINQYMWDEHDKFYYHVAMSDNSFKFEGESLKRQEIIGFLPMWAHVATKEQAKELVKHLKNPDTFWRKFGVPTLSASDPNYTAFVDGCCRWNGPIWLLWDYMVFDGLRNYGYEKDARQLADKMILAVSTQLEKNHRFWESYSPDYPMQESPSNYIWDSIMAKLLIDIYQH